MRLQHKRLLRKSITILFLLFAVGFTVYSIATDNGAGIAGGFALAVGPLVTTSTGDVYELLGKGNGKKPGGQNYVKGSIDGAVKIVTATGGDYSVFGQNKTALAGVLAGAGQLTNQTGTAGTYGEEGHIVVKAIKFNIVNLFTTAVDFLTIKQIAQYARATFRMGNYVLWEGWLYTFLREDLVTFNLAAPADSVTTSNPFNTVSFDRDGYKINKGDSFELIINLSVGVALPAAEVATWFFTCSLLGKKTLPRVQQAV
jgi:hypothetical protein